MLHRQDEEGFIVISQPAHAWVSGQLARHWRNTRLFAGVAEEVFFAAEQHDIGFVPWENAPTLNPETRLPHSFLDLPTDVHLDLWSSGIREMIKFGRFSALLVSLHFSRIAEEHLSSLPPGDAETTREFLNEQDGLQTSLRTSLQNDFLYAPFSTDEIIQHARRLVSLWDWMSLLLCLGPTKDLETVCRKPADLPELHLTPLDHTGLRVAVFPWPFRGKAVRAICEGRRLVATFGKESEMRDALRAAARVALPFELVPGTNSSSQKPAA